MVRDEQVRALEGVGYVSAVMIAAAGFTDSASLRLFNVGGLVFGLIAVVRLLGLSLRVRLAALDASRGELPEPRQEEHTEEQDSVQ